MGIVKYLTMDELKRLSIPSKMLKFFNHSSFTHYEQVCKLTIKKKNHMSNDV